MKTKLAVLALAIAGGAMAAAGQQQQGAAQGNAQGGAQANRGGGAALSFKFSSPAFTDGADIPDKYTCKVDPTQVAGRPSADAKTTSIPFQWSDAPKGTVSFALVFSEQDTHPGRGPLGVTHWLLWNIPGTATSIAEGLPTVTQLPDGTIQGQNNQGVSRFFAPCPPPGTRHHYIFELWALDTKLDLPPTASRPDLMKAVEGHVIGVGNYIGFFRE